MAMNYLEKKRQEAQQPAEGLRGVSANTQAQQQKYQQGYQPSQQTQAAQQNLQNIQQQKPQSYTSKYGAALDGILAQIQNPQDFKYSFDGDEMFKYYADLYTQQAKQGAANAMGNAAALTGGYGNSWASAQANQAYQQALLPLFERGMDLRDRAYQQYRDKQGDLMDQAGLLQGLDATDYGRYRDTVGDYYADLDRATAAAQDERNFDYNNYRDMLDYWQGMAQQENADFQAAQDQNLREAQLAWQQDTDARDFDESVRRADQDEAFRQAQLAENVRQADLDEAYRRDSLAQSQAQFEASTKLDYDQLAQNQAQFEASMSEEQRQYNQKMAANWVADILASGQIPSTELLVAAGLSYEDAQKLVAEARGSGGPGNPEKQASAAAVSLATGYKGLGALGTNYEALANAAADEMKNYDEGSAEYLAAASLNKAYSGAAEQKDKLMAGEMTQGKTSVASEARAAEYAKLIEDMKKKKAGT